MARYTLEERIGEGGMAEVFRARSRGFAGFDRRVAIKRLLPHFACDTAVLARFIDEARIGARLRHPGIVAMLDFYEESGQLHLVEELVEGHSLDALLRRCAKGLFFTPRLIAHVALEALDALAYAHAQGVLHRDVSTCNLLLSFNGEVKLVDFGLANARFRLGQTQPGAVAGKFAYLSPERLQGLPATPGDDVFALGVVVGRLLGATHPATRFDAETKALANLSERMTAKASARASVGEVRKTLLGLPRAERADVVAFVQAPAEELAALPALEPLVAQDSDDGSGASGWDETTLTVSSSAEFPLD